MSFSSLILVVFQHCKICVPKSWCSGFILSHSVKIPLLVSSINMFQLLFCSICDTEIRQQLTTHIKMTFNSCRCYGMDWYFYDSVFTGVFNLNMICVNLTTMP